MDYVILVDFLITCNFKPVKSFQRTICLCNPVDYFQQIGTSCKHIHAVNTPTPLLYGEQGFKSGNIYDSSSLTNEKDHHYFLNSADVCW